MALLSLSNVTLRFGGFPFLDGVEFHIERGDRIALLGSNGAGKSTLLRVLAREIKPDDGKVIWSGNIRVGYLPQQVPTHLTGTVLDIVHPPDAPDPDGMGLLEAEQIIERLALDPHADFSTLSGGTRRRALLAKALLGKPDVILLDEPTNHLDIESISWLEDFLLRNCPTFLFITHDRAFLRRLAQRIAELDRGRLSHWTCDYDTFLRRKQELLDAEEKQWAQFDKKLAQEEAWIRRGVKARRTRNEGRVRALMALRAERRQRRERAGSVRMAVQEAERTGQTVLAAKNVSFSYGDRPVIRDFTTVISRGDRIGILGPNGCGKTTLLRLLLEKGCPGVVHGTNLQIAYADQLRGALNEEASLADNIAAGRDYVTIGGSQRHIFGYLQDFLFHADRIRQPVKVLSGGERNRLLLARLFAEPSNVLVLDEPTNDLDYDTLELLEEQLEAYQGTVLLVSHDRTFLNNVVTSVLAFEKHPDESSGQWLGPDEGWYVNDYVGGYDDWVATRITKPPGQSRTKPVDPSPPQPAAKKLSYKEKQELETLPARIETLEAEQTSLTAQLADPAFFKKGGPVVAKATQRAAAIAAELEAVYARWAELGG